MIPGDENEGMTEDELREAEMYGDGETDEVSPASYRRQQRRDDGPTRK